MRRFLITLGAVALVAVVALGLSQASGGQEDPPPAPERFDLAAAQRELAGAPEPFAALHARANRLEDSGFREKLRELRGHPVVINKWASWCGPCRAEFPVFQRVATRLGKEVAFLGLNAGDNRGDAAKFLQRFPVPFPSYTDPSEKLARTVGAQAYFPQTVFIDAAGERYVHQGQYRTEADLVADIDRYAR